jgi:predicted lipid-binding transport protein (Tim44 family)
MGDSVQGLEILFWAAVAGVVLYRLRSVLGRRTGNERPPRDPLSRESSASAGAGDKGRGDKPHDGVIALPLNGRGKPSAEPAPSHGAPETIGIDPDSAIAKTLNKIRAADRHFDTAEFMTGARAAYAMIVEAFASGDQSVLKPLLGTDVLADFRGAISGRAARGETVESHVADIVKSEITDAALRGASAEITIRFESDIVRCVRDSENRVIEGDPTDPSRVTDVWTFSRDTESDDPNWALIATSTEQ